MRDKSYANPGSDAVCIFKLSYLCVFGCAGCSLPAGFPPAGRVGAALPLRLVDFSLWWLLSLRSTGSRAHEPQQLWRVGSEAVVPGLWSTGSVVAAYGLSRTVARGIFPDQGSNLCVLHWQADSLPLSHKGSPDLSFQNVLTALAVPGFSCV